MEVDTRYRSGIVRVTMLAMIFFFPCIVGWSLENPAQLNLAQAFDEIIDLEKLRGSEHWEILYQDTTGEPMELHLNHMKWMMDFLHWRPLTDERKQLDMAYVRNLLKTFWGPAMPFELTGVENTLTVNGHPAFEVEGTLGQGRIRTRFIVWNCPETNRHFIADININQARKTPPELFEWERKSALTIRCHGDAYAAPGISPLNNVYTNELLGISFLLPSGWNTAPFTREEWYPEGITRMSGSLWTLLNDSEKGVHLYAWKADDMMIPETIARELQDRMSVSFPTGDDGQWRVISFDLQDPVIDDGYLRVSGRFTSEEKGPDWSEVKPHLFQAFLFDANGTRCLLVATMTDWQEIWRRPVNLTPDTLVFKGFIRDQVISSLRTNGDLFE